MADEGVLIWWRALYSIYVCIYKYICMYVEVYATLSFVIASPNLSTHTYIYISIVGVAHNLF